MRWTKLLRDVSAESGRALIMLAAIAFALFAVTAMLSAYGIVTREVSVNYLSTNPASATIDVEAVTPEMLQLAKTFPGITDAEPRSVIEARVEVGGEWMRMLLFVVDDFETMRLNLFRPVSGAWPPPEGTILIERMAAALIGAGEGGTVTIKTPNGAPTEVPVSGIVHDTTLAPAWQEQSGYGYLTMKTYAALGETPAFEELRILVGGNPGQAQVDAKALELADALRAQGFDVHDVKVPPVGQHPHQGQIGSALLMFLSLAVMALVLAAILVAAVLAATLARQVREIGVMKAIGARSGQIAVTYVGALLALGAIALVVSVPLGVLAAGALSNVMADTMNFTVTNYAVPLWVYGVVIAAGLLMPVIAALPAIVRASRITVREALSSTGVTSSFGSGLFDKALGALRGLGVTWLLAGRNTFRRRGRLLLSLALLATGGALFVTALSAREGWREIAASVLTNKHYDVEFRFAGQVGEDRITAALEQSGATERYEVWGVEQTSSVTEGRQDVMRTYPDRGHGSFAILGAPPATDLVTLPVIEGRWLTADDTDALVLTQQNHRQTSGLEIGGKVVLSVAGQPQTWTLVGVVQEIGGGGAYVNKASYDRLAGADAGRMARIVLRSDLAGGREAALAAIEAAFAAAGIGIERAVPLDTLYLALVGHVEVPVSMLVSASVLLALIGGLGLASMMTVNVVERTREIGVMKAVGALPGTVVMMIVGEGLFTAVLSWIVALVVALPLIAGIGQFGAAMFGTPLPFVVSIPALAIWFGLVTTIALVASAAPAFRASRLVVREALAYT
ncbi:MAG: ABC transporter permease [Devosia nanyangense]|uniref:ABC transporter permease n=1 Tax=Devosia nanyangense TaxID=1228055 RepID=A0A933NY24_9HYPH|nr:ABC transporter permease [Devosia nanyangense]